MQAESTLAKSSLLYSLFLPLTIKHTSYSPDLSSMSHSLTVRHLQGDPSVSMFQRLSMLPMALHIRLTEGSITRLLHR